MTDWLSPENNLIIWLMANFVQTNVVISCEESNKEQVAKILKDCFLGEHKGQFFGDFNKLLPMPEELEGTPADGSCYSWYEWHCDHWGTKWNIGHEDSWVSDDFMYLSWQTAWSVAYPIIRELSVRLGELATITCSYADEDLGCNCGEFVAHNGNVEVTKGWEDYCRDSVSFACEVWGYDEEEYLDEEGSDYDD